jgi:hypothetical protein
MSCSDDNVYQGYPINLVGVVPASSIGCVVGTAMLGPVAVMVRARLQVDNLYSNKSLINRLRNKKYTVKPLIKIDLKLKPPQ